MTRFRPHPYQQRAIDFALTHDKCGLFLPMGAGKTVSTLTVISTLLMIDVSRVLIIAPVRVAKTTWPDEIKKWEHTKDLKYSVITGTAKQREKAAKADADIFLIGKENTKWLCDSGLFNFDMLVIDELSTFKNPQSQRFKALKKQMKKVKRFIGLTGTPAPRGIPDLWSQIYLIDEGERLGKTLTQFRNEFLQPERWNQHIVYSWIVKRGAEQRIYKLLEDVCMSMKQEECAQLPDVQYLEVKSQMPRQALEQYKKFKKEMVLELQNNQELTAVNAGVLCGELLQMSSGEVYVKDEDGNATGESVRIHDAKMEALDDLITSANGQPVLIFYYFKHELKRLIEYCKKNKLTYGTLDNLEEQQTWNNRKLDVLLLNPASAGHGLNLQAGGSIIIWYTLPNWNLELYQQANARLYRQGQKENVRIYHILTENTIDKDMMAALDKKEVTQSSLLNALVKCNYEEE